MYKLRMLAFWKNEEVREEYDVYDHYVGPANNRPPPSFHIAVDCHEGNLLILRSVDETFAKPLWVAKVFLNQILQSFDKFKWSTTNQRHEDVIWHYTCWDTNHNFGWKVDSEQ